jgi:hypothetical protein
MSELDGYKLVRVKRSWVPERIWRVFCVGNLAAFTPWRELLTRKVES